MMSWFAPPPPLPDELLWSYVPWVPPDATQCLPNELLSSVLEHLEQPALLRAAAVSRRWRAVATRLPNYYRSHYMALEQPDEDKVHTLETVITDAEDAQYNLGLMVDVEEIPEGVSDAEYEKILSALAPLLHRCVSRLIVLELNVPATLAAVLLEALYTPAPLLRKLTLDFRPEPGSHPVMFPQRLFERTAPHLEVVCLCELLLLDPLPLFSSVHTLTIWYDDAAMRLNVLQKCFPALRRLDIERLEHEMPIPAAEFGLLNQLHSLAVGTRMDPLVAASVLLADLYIPKVSVHNRRLVLDSPDVLSTWLSIPGPIRTVLWFPERHGVAVDESDGETESGSDAAGQHEPPVRPLHLHAQLTFLNENLAKRISFGRILPPQCFQILSGVRNIRNTTMLQIDEALLSLLITVIGRLPGLEYLSILLTSPPEWGFCTILPPINDHLDAPLFPRLRDLALKSAGPQVITPAALRVLSSTFTPQPDGVLRLWLEGGAYLSLDDGVWGPFDTIVQDGVAYDHMGMERNDWQPWFSEGNNNRYTDVSTDVSTD